MSKHIIIHNKSNHNQTFEIHGWNNNQNMTVGAGKTVQWEAHNGSSGAIIALHDGHEGEQAEITKGSGNSPDFFDCSNIIGAGGNITVQQVGEPSTKKGDPNFMQDCNRAWHAASQETRKSLSDCVHLDAHGNVHRIDALKDHPKLEEFCRRFANGQTYLGVGSTPGHPGNPADDGNSSAGIGIKDIIITYSDGNANP